MTIRLRRHAVSAPVVVEVRVLVGESLPDELDLSYVVHPRGVGSCDAMCGPPTCGEVVQAGEIVGAEAAPGVGLELAAFTGGGAGIRLILEAAAEQDRGTVIDMHRPDLIERYGKLPRSVQMTLTNRDDACPALLYP